MHPIFSPPGTRPWHTGSDDNWNPHNIPDSIELYRQGKLDLCFADTHNSTTGNYGGMAILPDVIALNILALLD